MWVLVGLLPALIVLGLIVAGIAALFRGRGDGRGLEFPTVVAAYAALVMLVSLFLTATGGGLLLKAGFGAMQRDFSYNTQSYSSFDPATRTESRRVDPSDNAIRDDVATGLSLAFAGVVLFVPHALGAAILRRRPGAVSRTVSRGEALLGLATATVGLLASGATALNDIMRRYVLGGTDTLLPFERRHPGGPLAIAIVMLPLVVWFGWRLWREFAEPDGQEPAALASSPATPPATG